MVRALVETTRPGDESEPNGVSNRDVGKLGALGVRVAQSRKTGVQAGPCRRRSLQCSEGDRLFQYRILAV